MSKVKNFNKKVVSRLANSMETGKDTPEADKEVESSNEDSQDSAQLSDDPKHNQNYELNLEEDKELIAKIRGDAIGDTLYSERFILKTLMELKELNDGKLEENLEQKLEIIWDQSIESSVVKFLLNFDFLDIASVIVDSTEDERLIEILLGIIGKCILITFSKL